MPNRCVAGNCGNFANTKEGIILHEFPFFDDERGEAKRRRKKWVDFVKAKRAKWQPTKASRLCSAHFTPDSFQRRYHFLEGLDEAVIKRLNRDELGVCAIPTIHAVAKTTTSVAGPSFTAKKRQQRMVRFIYQFTKKYINYSNKITYHIFNQERGNLTLKFETYLEFFVFHGRQCEMLYTME